MKVVYLSDHICATCRMPGSLDPNKQCEFCRNREPKTSIAAKMAETDSTEIYKLFLALLLVGSLVIAAGNYLFTHF